MEDIKIPIIGMDAVTYRHAEDCQQYEKRIESLRITLVKYAQQDNWFLDREADVYTLEDHLWYSAVDALKSDDQLEEQQEISRL